MERGIRCVVIIPYRQGSRGPFEGYFAFVFTKNNLGFHAISIQMNGPVLRGKNGGSRFELDNGKRRTVRILE